MSQDAKVPAGEGIMPCGTDLTPATWPGTTGSKGPGNDARVPAGEGIMPGDAAPWLRGK